MFQNQEGRNLFLLNEDCRFFVQMKTGQNSELAFGVSIWQESKHSRFSDSQLLQKNWEKMGKREARRFPICADILE